MGRNVLFALTLLGTLLFASSGCETLTQGVVAVDEALYEIVPTHPVTGRPMVNLVTEGQEIATAQGVWQRLEAAVRQEGIRVDPPGPRLDQIQRVFGDLVGVAHRQHLPWEVHLLRHEMPNAMTPGGGMVFVFEGLFTDFPAGHGWVHPYDDEIAAALAHEIGHVTLMHMAVGSSNARKDTICCREYNSGRYSRSCDLQWAGNWWDSGGTSGCGPEGRMFESCWARHLFHRQIPPYRDRCEVPARAPPPNPND